MPRVFDPERSDPTVKLISSVRSWFEERKYRLSNDEISIFISKTLRGPKYSKMVGEYFERSIPFPDIVVKDKCSNGHFFYDTRQYGQAAFPAVFKRDKNEIILCTDKIRNLLELQENLDRELIHAFDFHIPSGIASTENSLDAQHACTQIRACRAQLDNYTNMGDDSKKQLTTTCARFLLRHRGPNEDRLPHDMWVRYSEKLLDKFDYCFNYTFPFQATTKTAPVNSK